MSNVTVPSVPPVRVMVIGAEVALPLAVYAALPKDNAPGITARVVTVNVAATPPIVSWAEVGVR
jgi:hypothetical protein